MSQVKTHFISGRNGPFYEYLEEKVNQYFKENDLKKTGNIKLYTKTVIFLSLLVSLYILLVFVIPPSIFSIPLCVLEGMVFAGIGFCVMHDGNHGSYSSEKKTNVLMGLTLNLLGGINFFWKEKHNVKHHTFVNVEHEDEDIYFGPLVRMSPHQKRYRFHKYQVYYLLVLYGIFYFGWISLLDFIKYFKKVRTKTGLNRKEHTTFWVTKIVYGFVWIAVPLWYLGPIAMWGYFITGATCSIIISFVFQLAHVVEGTEFLLPNVKGELPHEFAVHQVVSTNNFSPDSKAITWYVGGLNYQIEHHLFPRISHVHYPKISKIVQDGCNKFNIPYNCSLTMWSAIGEHIKLLDTLGSLN